MLETSPYVPTPKIPYICVIQARKSLATGNMQIALFVVLLCVGIGVAARLSGNPKQVRSIQDAAIRYVVNAVHQITSRGKSRLYECEIIAQIERGDLLTKWVCRDLMMATLTRL